MPRRRCRRAETRGPFTYTKPRITEDAVRAVAAGGPGTRFIAGDMTLYDLMKLDVEAPTRILDIAALPGLTKIDSTNPRELVFGVGARMAEVAAHAGLREAYPALVELIWSWMDRTRWARRADLKRFICRSRRLVGWCEFSA